MRLNYYKFLKSYDDKKIQLYDFFNVNWSNFNFPSGFTTHYVTKAESDRPYLIATLYYNDPFLIEDIILVNKLSNFLELKVGSELKIPALTDLQDFREQQFVSFETQLKNELS